MTDRPFLQLSEKWRLASDEYQWIVQRKQGTPTKKSSGWRSIMFVASTKRTLLRVLAETGAVVDHKGAAGLRELPDTFAEWRASQVPGNALADLLRRAAE